MDEPVIRIDDAVIISVERMIRFCYLAKIFQECVRSGPRTTTIPVHLTRWGTMLFETASFLYSLFEDDKNAINLEKIWRGFDHPFKDDLKDFSKRLKPFKKELRLFRNRVGFHGSLDRKHEQAGLGIFDVNSDRGREFSRIIRDMQNLAPKMIEWYTSQMHESVRPREIWHDFITELKG